MRADAGTTASADGRHQRTQSTRRCILDAARELILAGDFDPTVAAIATQADITRRTLFRHFPDRETLHTAIILDAQDYARAVMDEPFPTACQPSQQPSDGGDAWPLLLDEVIGRRARLYEYLLPLFISVVYQRFRSTSSPNTRRKDVHRRRQRLREILPSAMASDALLLESLDATLSIEYWITLRVDQQLSIARAKKVLRYAVSRLT
ncbi:MAG: TetR/AcrR family transcriptional regulator [Pseudomonadaceae bacterium]|nr:TetR/AcrR family transcriptional regulator [Pseudomonadaceae bacterium]